MSSYLHRLRTKPPVIKQTLDLDFHSAGFLLVSYCTFFVSRVGKKFQSSRSSPKNKNLKSNSCDEITTSIDRSIDRFPRNQKSKTFELVGQHRNEFYRATNLQKSFLHLLTKQSTVVRIIVVNWTKLFLFGFYKWRFNS